MDKGFQILLFLILYLLSSQKILSQKQAPFCGELIYSIERVDQKDSVKAEMIIYARDSLIRVVNFNSETGKQELIKHLRLGKSYLLIETPKQKFAIRTNEHIDKDTTHEYTFKKSFAYKKISGLKALKIKVKQREIKNELSFYVYNKISAKYANAFTDLPGLPLLYYIPTDLGLYKYKLKSIKKSEPPLQLFSFGKEYKIVTFEEFTQEFSRLYELGE
jgi:hypothetical protein